MTNTYNNKICLVIFFIVAFIAVKPAHLSKKITANSNSDVYNTLFDEMVKSCSEFIARFNNEELHPLALDPHNDDDKLNFKSLFDISGEPTCDTETFMKKFDVFYDSVINNDVKLSFESNKWFAEQQVQFLLNKKPITLSLILRPTITSVGYEAWTVDGVRGMDQLMPNDSIYRFGISGSDSDKCFSELYDAFDNDYKRFSKYRGEDVPIDTLTYFFAMVEKGNIKFNGLIDTKFYFFDVPDHMFVVEWFDRPTSNSGWLISNLTYLPECEKRDYINKFLGR